MSEANYEWMAAPILVVFFIVLIPLYLRGRIGTVPEYLERRFDQRARRYFSVLTIVSNIIVDTAGTLFAGALVLTGFIPGLDLFSAALLLAAIAAAYTAAGGLAAVVYTDVLQAVILLVGACVVTVLAFAAIDFDWKTATRYSRHSFEGLFHYLQTALAYLVPPVAALFLLGALWRRPGGNAALATLIGGHALSMLLFALNVGGVFEMHFTLVVGILFGASFSILIVTGLALPPAALSPNCVWTPDMARPETPDAWWADYRAQAFILLLLTIALVWAFR